VTEIPFLPSTPARFTTQIGDREMTIDQRWNEEDQAWYFDLYDVDETPVLKGAKITLGTFIGRASEHPIFIRGAIMAQDTSRDGAEAGYDDLGVRVRVWYMTDAELAMARALTPPPPPGSTT